MVTVLSLNLLYQPCEAGGNQQADSNYQQQLHSSDSHSQGKISCTKKLLNLVKTALKVSLVMAFGLFMFCVGAIGGVLNGLKNGLKSGFKDGQKSVLGKDIKTLAKEHCKTTGSCVFIPTDEISKGCLKALRVVTHPVNQKCSELNTIHRMLNEIYDKQQNSEE